MFENYNIDWTNDGRIPEHCLYKPFRNFQLGGAKTGLIFVTQKQLQRACTAKGLSINSLQHDLSNDLVNEIL